MRIVDDDIARCLEMDAVGVGCISRGLDDDIVDSEAIAIPQQNVCLRAIYQLYIGNAAHFAP